MTRSDTETLIWGPTFFDLVFGGLAAGSTPGTEVWADRMASGPGGVATTAVAAARLGLRTSFATAFGGDATARALRAALEAEGIDLGPSSTRAAESTPVTVSLAYDGDRAMVSHGGLGREVPQLREPPPASVALVPIDPGPWAAALDALAVRGTRLVACGAWDASGRWALDAVPALPLLDTLVLNAEEARRFTGERDLDVAVAALLHRVPCVVVTEGSDGARAARGTELARTEGIRVEALDPTGAGDVLLAGLLFGLVRGLGLEAALRLGVAASALSVERLGGAFSAPGCAQLRAWLAARQEPVWRALAEQLPDRPDPVLRRAEASFG